MNDNSKKPIDDKFAHGFAMSKRIYPYFQVEDGETDPFEGCYKITKDAITEIIDYIDDALKMSEHNLTFSNIEKTFTAFTRNELIDVFQYICLSHQLTDDFFDELVSEIKASIRLTPLAEEDSKKH